MNKEFIPYEQALELKNSGIIFSYSECLKWYDPSGRLYSVGMSGDTPAPTFSQIFRLFRDEYKCTYEIIVREESTITEYIAWVSKFNNNKIEKICVINYSDSLCTYEEAELACLKKLIEVVKSNNNG
jgi:hypothetical protein